MGSMASTSFRSTTDAGFHFSRASYVLSLLRPQVMRDLQLKVKVLCVHKCTCVLHVPPPYICRNTGSSCI